MLLCSRELQDANADTGGLSLPEGQAGVSEANLNGVAKRSAAKKFNCFAFDEPKLVEALYEGVFAGDCQHFCPLAGLEFAQRGHCLFCLSIHGTDENLRAFAATQTELAAANVQQARSPRLHHQKTATRTNAKLRQATDPAGVSSNFCDLGDFASSQHIQGHQHLSLTLPCQTLLRPSLS